MSSDYESTRESLRLFPWQYDTDDAEREAVKYDKWAEGARSDTHRQYYLRCATAIRLAIVDHEASIVGQPHSVSQLKKALVGLSYDAGPMNRDAAERIALSIYNHGGIEKASASYPEDEDWQRVMKALNSVLNGATKRSVDDALNNRETRKEGYNQRMQEPVSHTVAACLKDEATAAQERLQVYLEKPDPHDLFKSETTLFAPMGIGGSGNSRNHRQINKQKDVANRRIQKHEQQLQKLRASAATAEARYEGYIAGTHHANGQRRKKTVKPLIEAEVQP